MNSNGLKGSLAVLNDELLLCLKKRKMSFTFYKERSKCCSWVGIPCLLLFSKHEIQSIFPFYVISFKWIWWSFSQKENEIPIFWPGTGCIVHLFCLWLNKIGSLLIQGGQCSALPFQVMLCWYVCWHMHSFSMFNMWQNISHHIMYLTQMLLVLLITVFP